MSGSMVGRHFFIPRPDWMTPQGDVHGSNDFIGITFGQKGYSLTTIYDQGHADALNEHQHGRPLTRGEEQAALICSGPGDWAFYDETRARMSQEVAA